MAETFGKNFGKNFGKLRCKICGRMISLNGLAQYSHEAMHAREQAKEGGDG